MLCLSTYTQVAALDAPAAPEAPPLPPTTEAPPERTTAAEQQALAAARGATPDVVPRPKAWPDSPPQVRGGRAQRLVGVCLFCLVFLESGR